MHSEQLLISMILYGTFESPYFLVHQGYFFKIIPCRLDNLAQDKRYVNGPHCITNKVIYMATGNSHAKELDKKDMKKI